MVFSVMVIEASHSAPDAPPLTDLGLGEKGGHPFFFFGTRGFFLFSQMGTQEAHERPCPCLCKSLSARARSGE